MDMNILSMCQAFAKHLMGDRLFEEATQALLKSRALVPEGKGTSPVHFGSFRPGSIDCTAHQETFQKLIKAMGEKRICKITYRAMWDGRAMSYYVKPLKIFSHKDTVYLHARKARSPGQKHGEADYDPLLAVHRIKEVEITDRRFEFPSDYNFEKLFNKEFGVIKEDAFRVTVEFKGWAAGFVSERTWSPDQKILKRRDGTIRLTFTTSSEPEFISWLLSFREEAKALRPKWLVDTVKQALEATTRMYP
jgi:predicted DNA-binding transcriptional regulator YafY